MQGSVTKINSNQRASRDSWTSSPNANSSDSKKHEQAKSLDSRQQKIWKPEKPESKWSVHGCRKKNGQGHCTKSKWSLGYWAHWLLDLFGRSEGANDKATIKVDSKTFDDMVLSAPSAEELSSPVRISVCQAYGDPDSRDLIQATEMMDKIFTELETIGEPITLKQVVDQIEEGLAALPEAIIAEKNIPLLAKTIMSQRNDDFASHCNWEATAKEKLDQYAINGKSGEALFETAVKTLGPLFMTANKKLLDRAMGIPRLKFISTMLRAKNLQ